MLVRVFVVFLFLFFFSFCGFHCSGCSGRGRFSVIIIVLVSFTPPFCQSDSWQIASHDRHHHMRLFMEELAIYYTRFVCFCFRNKRCLNCELIRWYGVCCMLSKQCNFYRRNGLLFVCRAQNLWEITVPATNWKLICVAVKLVSFYAITTTTSDVAIYACNALGVRNQNVALFLFHRLP